MSENNNAPFAKLSKISTELGHISALLSETQGNQDIQCAVNWLLDEFDARTVQLDQAVAAAESAVQGVHS